MLNIFLARHGQNKDNVNGIINGHRDLPLTALGEQQAQKLAGNILKEGIVFGKVYVSPLMRSKKTGQIVCSILGLPEPEVLDLLIERDFGFMTGELTADIPRLCPSSIAFSDNIARVIEGKGVELFPDLYERAVRTLNFVRSRHVSESVLLAGHGDMGKMIYGAYYGIGWLKALSAFRFSNCALVRLSEGSNPFAPDIIRID